MVCNKLLNIFNLKKKYIILRYSNKLYSIVKILKKYFFEFIFIIKGWLLLVFLFKKTSNKKIKFFDKNNKENYYSYKKLKYLFLKNKHGIIFTPIGIISLSKAIKLKKGGYIFCLIN